MAIAVLGDIHANKFALEAAIRKIDEVDEWNRSEGGPGIERVIVHGDVLGRGPWPLETLDCLVAQDERLPGVYRFIPGNHEEAMNKLRNGETASELKEYNQPSVVDSWVLHYRLLFESSETSEPHQKRVGLFDRMVNCDDCSERKVLKPTRLKRTELVTERGAMIHEAEYGGRNVFIYHADPKLGMGYFLDGRQEGVWKGGQEGRDWHSIEGSSYLNDVSQLVVLNGGGEDVVTVSGHTHIPSISEYTHEELRVVRVDTGSVGWQRKVAFKGWEDVEGYGTFALIHGDDDPLLPQGKKEALVRFAYNPNMVRSGVKRKNAELAAQNVSGEYKLPSTWRKR